MMTLRLKGVSFLRQAMLPLIRDDGKIVNISRGLARFSLPGYSACATMRVEVMGMVLCSRRVICMARSAAAGRAMRATTGVQPVWLTPLPPALRAG